MQQGWEQNMPFQSAFFPTQVEDIGNSKKQVFENSC